MKMENFVTSVTCNCDADVKIVNKSLPINFVGKDSINPHKISNIAISK
jgi:hypothetical protein